MIQELVDWIYQKYGVQIPKLDIQMGLIIIAGLIILIFSIFNPFGK
jgi:hypothetical protein